MTAKRILILRTPSGISGDMFVTGLVKLAGLSSEELSILVEQIGVPALHDTVVIKAHSVNNISGWKMTISLPSEHSHRTFADIQKLIASSALTPRAKEISEAAFYELARAEGAIHDANPYDVTFHEVGALDSILDICLSAAVFDVLAPEQFVCSPLPVCDGTISCAHGLLAAPAPAVLHMLKGIPVYGIDSSGETVTPTALALLKAMDARFDGWPAVTVEDVVRVYGGRVVPNVPNGAIFVAGSGLPVKADNWPV